MLSVIGWIIRMNTSVGELRWAAKLTRVVLHQRHVDLGHVARWLGHLLSVDLGPKL